MPHSENIKGRLAKNKQTNKQNQGKTVQNNKREWKGGEACRRRPRLDLPSHKAERMTGEEI